jgi:dimethylhistidine N-methyltransferase
VSPDEIFLDDVLTGLSKDSKMLSPKYFYDERGSTLFEEICKTPEYYPTRTEAAMIAEIAAQIVSDVPRHAVLVEFGSGASEKTRLILDAAPQITIYVPIDISEQALRQAAWRIESDYAAISVIPLLGDFMQVIALPEETVDRVKIGFFPGSTIGNFTPQEAVHFLRSARRLLGDDSALIVGADLLKDEATLIAAYNDAQGVTANFNKNILVRINRELEADFNLDEFDHLALWNPQCNRIEMHLVSRIDQTVSVAGRAFKFRAGERLHTENSHKFTVDSFSRMACAAGWTIKRSWIGSKPEFGIFSMSASG